MDKMMESSLPESITILSPRASFRRPKNDEVQDISELKIKAEFIAHHDDKFQVIRGLDGITNQQMVASFAPSNNCKAVFKAG